MQVIAALMVFYSRMSVSRSMGASNIRNGLRYSPIQAMRKRIG